MRGRALPAPSRHPRVTTTIYTTSEAREYYHPILIPVLPRSPSPSSNCCQNECARTTNRSTHKHPITFFYPATRLTLSHWSAGKRGRSMLTTKTHYTRAHEDSWQEASPKHFTGGGLLLVQAIACCGGVAYGHRSSEAVKDTQSCPTVGKSDTEETFRSPRPAPKTRYYTRVSQPAINVYPRSIRLPPALDQEVQRLRRDTPGRNALLRPPSPPPQQLKTPNPIVARCRRCHATVTPGRGWHCSAASQSDRSHPTTSGEARPDRAAAGAYSSPTAKQKKKKRRARCERQEFKQGCR